MNSIFPAFPAFPALPALQKDHWQHGLREQESESARERESESVRSRARRACESSEVDPWDYLAGVTVFEMGLSLPWHEPVLAKAVRTVYLRNAVIFQYNTVGGRAASHPKHHSVPRGPSVLSSLGAPLR
jgi:hypothetical protein